MLIKKLVLEHARPPSASGIKGLTSRLLKRVYTSDERHYIGGKFLLPTAIRYDGQSKKPTEQEKPCLFFNFPYLSIEHHHPKNCTECAAGGSEDHPMRSLFQFRYRLQTTKVKDSSQIVAKIDANVISKCIPSALRQRFVAACEEEAPLIHVPQVWIALISGGKLANYVKELANASQISYAPVDR